ncbi:MAG: DUF63 family protein [Thermoplasmatota archaeon]
MDEKAAVPEPQPATATPPLVPAAATPSLVPATAAATPPVVPPAPGWLERVPPYAVPLLLVAIPLLVALAALVWPEQVYQNFVWKYLWGPIHADAAGNFNECLLPDGTIRATACFGSGVETHSGYNILNTAAWAVLLGLCIVGAAQLLQRFKAQMDGRLIVAATLWVVAGSLFHVLEDAQLMSAPLQYFFITPIIYLVFAAMGILSFVLGHYLSAVAERRGVGMALQKLWLLLAVPVLLYLYLDLARWDQVNHWVSPILVAVFALVAFAAASWRFQRLGRIEPNELVAFLSIGWILLGITYLIGFAQSPWPAFGGVRNPVLTALWAPLLALGVAGVVGLVALSQRKRHPVGAAAFLRPINLLLVFSQMLDAFATSIGIDLGGYHEKHVLSAGLIDTTRSIGRNLHVQALVDYPTFLGFGPVKLAVSLLVIYAIDVSSPEESRRHPTLIGLVKFAIIMVGIGPGIRDFVRMALGI